MDVIGELRHFEEAGARPDLEDAAFHTGHCSFPGGYRCSLILAEYRRGAGRLLFNSFPLMENLDAHPAADRLLVNLISQVGR